MALRDYRWQITGTLDIGEGVTLNNPEFRVPGLEYYDAESFTAGVLVHFKEGEGLYEHPRVYPFELSEQTEALSADNIVTFIDQYFPDAKQTSGDRLR